MLNVRQYFFSLLCIFTSFNASAVEVKGVFQLSAVYADNVSSWQEHGTGQLRSSDSELLLRQAVLSVSQDLLPTLTFSGDFQLSQDGEHHAGVTQIQLQYKPLSRSTIRFRGRVGMFFPKMSVENVDTAWLSPFTYTNSAISSWIGEEMRVPGMEVTLFSPGRQRRSPWSWEWHVGAFKGNDPFGAIITWRGFALHDRQSLHTDRINFARYPAVIDRNIIWHPAWIEPFHEIDGQIGLYTGIHLRYVNQSQVRYYFYDNRANPLAVNGQRMYAWHTKFHSLAWSHKLGDSTRLLGQWMNGSTEMGDRFVYADFDAAYLMLSHTINAHRLSARFDWFDVDEDDHIAMDINSSRGSAVTFAWRYDINPNWQIGTEVVIVDSDNDNRPTVGEPVGRHQQQAMAVLQYRF
ncbi:hypothetical protein [Aestuariibacter salexigens]|uniref:hypothetical protein n=1 Tax=Aestuariibacter salexigens TaxID=226010 RepID=UPI00040884B6|nr:hypothetical protein [Aestuariibacter salexigens]